MCEFLSVNCYGGWYYLSVCIRVRWCLGVKFRMPVCVCVVGVVMSVCKLRM